MRLSVLLSLVVMVGWAQPVWACKSDMDCKGDRICQASQCVDPAPTRTPTTPYQGADVSKEDRSSFSINALGPLQLGLNPTWESGDDITTVFRLRLLNTGALSYLISALDDTTFYGGLGVGLGNHIFLKGGGHQEGFYIGFMGEYLLTVSRYEQVNITHFLAPQIELGHRWPDANGFTGVGVFLGVGVPVAANYDDTESILVGGFVWEQGWWQE